MKNKILYERSLRTCIVMLMVCIVFKVLGVKWLDLNTSIPILQGLNKTIMNSFGYLHLLIFICFLL